MLRYSGHS